jgi:hypothetical protein
VLARGDQAVADQHPVQGCPRRHRADVLLAEPRTPVGPTPAEPDPLDEVVWWRTDDFWQYALFAAIAYPRRRPSGCAHVPGATPASIAPQSVRLPRLPNVSRANEMGEPNGEPTLADVRPHQATISHGFCS